MIKDWPSEVKKLFWGDNLEELSWEKNQDYIVQTILERGDVEAVRWLLQRKSKQEIKNKLARYKLSDLSRNFWQIYL